MKLFGIRGSLALVALFGAAAGTALGLASEQRMLRRRRAGIRPAFGKTRRRAAPGERSSRGVLFDGYTAALTALEQLTEAGCPIQAVSLVMTDRTAERGFSPAGREQDEAALNLRFEALLLARALRPLAALGAPGSGVVGAGPIVNMLERAGLGTLRDLTGALEHCALDRRTARAVVEQLRDGGVLLVVPEQVAECTARLDLASRELELRGDDRPIETMLTPPEAAAGDQRAAYAPRFEPKGRS